MGNGAGGGGRQLVTEGGISYEWGGGRPLPPEPMLDPGLFAGATKARSNPKVSFPMHDKNASFFSSSPTLFGLIKVVL